MSQISQIERREQGKRRKENLSADEDDEEDEDGKGTRSRESQGQGYDPLHPIYFTLLFYLYSSSLSSSSADDLPF
jgi:hypothetical protein